MSIVIGGLAFLLGVMAIGASVLAMLHDDRHAGLLLVGGLVGIVIGGALVNEAHDDCRAALRIAPTAADTIAVVKADADCLKVLP